MTPNIFDGLYRIIKDFLKFRRQRFLMPKHDDDGNSNWLSVVSPVSSVQKTQIYSPVQQESVRANTFNIQLMFCKEVFLKMKHFLLWWLISVVHRKGSSALSSWTYLNSAITKVQFETSVVLSK